MRAAFFLLFLLAGNEALTVRANVETVKAVSSAIAPVANVQTKSALSDQPEGTSTSGSLFKEHTLKLNNQVIDDVQVTYSHRLKASDPIWIGVSALFFAIAIVFNLVVALFHHYFMGMTEVIKSVSRATGSSQKTVKKAVIDAYKMNPHMMSAETTTNLFAGSFGIMLFLLYVVGFSKNEMPRHFQEQYLTIPNYGGRTIDEMFNIDMSLSAAMDYDIGTFIGFLTSLTFLLLPLTEAMRLGIKGGMWRIFAASLVTILFGLSVIFNMRHFEKVHMALVGVLMMTMIGYMMIVTHFVRAKYPRAPRYHAMLVGITMTTSAMLLTTAFCLFALKNSMIGGIGELAAFVTFVGFLLACNSSPN